MTAIQKSHKINVCAQKFIQGTNYQANVQNCSKCDCRGCFEKLIKLESFKRN